MPGPVRPRPRPRPCGFTLVELLVVVTIVVLVSAVTLPAILPALAHRQVSEAARILQAALAGARDAAIRDNAPRGIRLLPDPVFNGSTTALAYNRFVPLETASDYTSGKVTITFPQAAGSNYTNYVEGPDPVGGPHRHPALRVDESPFDPTGMPNERTSWFWNVRIGDKVRFGDSGRWYTVVGPMVVGPLQGNADLFVNAGAPGAATGAPIVTDPTGRTYSPEYLYLVNGQDDNGDGFVDNGWDGFDNNYSGLTDEFAEWTEPEQWVGTELTNLLLATPDPTTGVRFLPNRSYTIQRRPTPAPGSRVTTLPGGVVIDATSWNSPTGAERSRLPIDPRSFYVDILVNSYGQVVPTTQYSSPTASTGLPFYHFWLTERQDVHELSDLWGLTGSPPVPRSNPHTGSSFLLPLPAGAYPTTWTPPPAVALEGERTLLTLFTRTGQITSNTIETFSLTDINAPFYPAQSGAREAK